MSNRLTIKGQVTIPKAVRDFLGLQEGGSSVEFTINDDGSVTVRKACAAAEHTTAESVQTASASPVRSRLQRPTRGFRASAPRAASHCGVLALLAGGSGLVAQVTGLRAVPQQKRSAAG